MWGSTVSVLLALPLGHFEALWELTGEVLWFGKSV